MEAFGTVVLGMTMFNAIILALVLAIVFAKSRLVSSGNVDIVVNGDASKTLHVHSGGTLLGTLAEQRIFIPSACGGKGSCGVCKVVVISGGGAMLPTELGHINRGEAREGCRLSCQVKVKENMAIEVPPEKRFHFALVAISRLNARHTPFTLRILMSRMNTVGTGTNSICGN
jgi:Na+-transporting NADH:ubiquinone oxidoreductase subunit F